MNLSGTTPMSDLSMTRFTSIQAQAGRTGVRHLASLLHLALRTHLTRQALLELDARERADIGISTSAAVAEAARLPWDTKPGPRRPSAGMAGAIQRYLERARSRQLISRMTARELRDIGLSPSNAQTEATKYFWQL
jgi:uncharacterized protein YjiS (DUF1127 family)